MVLGWMIYCAVIAALMAGAGILLEETARRTGHPVRWAWAGGLLGSLLVPLAALLRPAAPPPPVAPADMPGGVTVGEGYLVGALGPVQAGTSLPYLDPLLIGIWGGASGVLLLLGGWSMLRLARARAGWERALVEGNDVLLSEDVGPAVVGWLRPEIVLPRWVLAAPHAERRLVLQHEREHLRARDPLLMAAAAAAAVLLPWNLPLWWQLRRLRLAVEMDCDRRVVRRGGDLRGYASLLIEVGRRRAKIGQPLLALAEPASFLERRIRRMTAQGGRGWRGAVASAAAGVMLVAGACAVERPPEGTPMQEAPPVTGPDAAQVPSEPSFTPRDVEPVLQNVADFTRRLERLYPAVLKEAGIGGRTIAWVFVNAEGAVEQVRVQESSGHPTLDEAALEALRGARFAPARLEGTPVAVWVALPVTFQSVAEADSSVTTGGTLRADSVVLSGATLRADSIVLSATEEAVTPASTPRAMEVTPEVAAEPETARTAARAPATTNPAEQLPPEAAGHPTPDTPTFSPREEDPRLQNPREFTQLLDRVYPAELRDAGIGGRVLLWVFIDEEGRPQGVRTYESSGYPALDEAASQAILEARFSPATNRGEVVPVWIALPVTFATSSNDR